MTQVRSVELSNMNIPIHRNMNEWLRLDLHSDAMLGGALHVEGEESYLMPGRRRKRLVQSIMTRKT